MNVFQRLFKKEKKPSSIKICSFYSVWHRLGCPRELDHKIQVEMRSGKTAIYRMTDMWHEWDPADMVWYNYEFDHYKKSDEMSYPIY